MFTAILICFFVFKQETVYEMRISDWSSDVCSSDLPPLSAHLIRSWPFASSTCQLTCTRPPDTDSAPYLAAFVASSCRTRLSDMIVRGPSSTAAPGWITTASGLAIDRKRVESGRRVEGRVDLVSRGIIHTKKKQQP